jgi:hypothetical protein
MMWDIAFPGTVMLLKLVFKITIEQQIKPVDVAKAVLAFPIDIAFLAFSFGAALLYARPLGVMHTNGIRQMFVALVVAIILLVITTVFSKKSDNAFTLEKFKMTFLHVLVAYVLSFVAVWGAMNVGTLI